MKKLKIWSMMMLMTMVLPLMAACGSDDNDDGSSIFIPNGTYVEEYGVEMELFTMYINGNSIKIVITQYGQERKKYVGTYKISGNTIRITTSEGIESYSFKMSGNRVTIGDITYIKIS